MESVRWTVGVVGLTLLAGCGHSNPSQTATARTETQQLVAPVNPNDVNAWRTFMGQAILDVTHDKTLHPYSFVVPAGDTADATTRRRHEAMTIHAMLGRTAVPGNMIAFTGPDSTKVAEVVASAFQKLPAHTAQGLTVLFVGTPAVARTVESAVSAAGAQLRVRAMRMP
jgi:hypothetical protein